MKKLLLTLTLVFFFTFHSLTQNTNTINIINDTTICYSENIQLSVTGCNEYIWSPAEYLDNPNISNPTILTLNSTTVFNANCVYPNLVVNSDFEQGNTGFTTGYINPSFPGPYGLLTYEQTYTVNNNASNVHNSFNGNDHTNPPNGNFMIVNGSTQSDVSIWCQTLNITPFEQYSFSALVSSVIASNPAKLILNVNGQNIGQTYNATSNVGQWGQMQATWDAGSNTTANICIYSLNMGSGGNDFGLDDINFSIVDSDTTEVLVKIVELDLGNDTILCTGEDLNIQIPNIYDSILWDNNSSASSRLVQNDGEYWANITEDGCFANDTIDVNFVDVEAVDLGADLSICNDQSIDLQTNGNYENYLWSNNATTPTLTINGPGEYWLKAGVGGCIHSDTILVAVDVPIITDTNISLTFCNNGAIDIEVSTNAPPLSYEWENSSNNLISSNQDISLLPSGSYKDKLLFQQVMTLQIRYKFEGNYHRDVITRKIEIRR